MFYCDEIHIYVFEKELYLDHIEVDLPVVASPTWNEPVPIFLLSRGGELQCARFDLDLFFS